MLDGFELSNRKRFFKPPLRNGIYIEICSPRLGSLVLYSKRQIRNCSHLDGYKRMPVTHLAGDRTVVTIEVGIC